MSFISRGTRAAARPLRQSQNAVRQTARRNASHDAAHGESSHHADAGSTNEGFGKGFYVTVASIPLLYMTYQLSKSDGNIVERWYRDYQDDLAKKEAMDVLHTEALEQAIADRAVLYGETADHSRQLRYTEFFNVGSPHNVAAGEGTADLSKLKAKYEEQRKAMDSERAERMSSKSKQ